MSKFLISPAGPLVHPWLNKADTKYNADGLYHTDLDASGPEAEATAAKIEAAAVAYLQEYTQEMKPGEQKKWSIYLPFERVEDDDGNPTGVIRFTFKQNAKITYQKDGQTIHKDVQIELRDSKDQVIDVPVFGGTIARVMFSMRGVTTASTKQAGVRLDLAKVQIIKLQKGGGNSQGFGEVEGGYEADSSQVSFNQPSSSGDGEPTGEY